MISVNTKLKAQAKWAPKIKRPSADNEGNSYSNKKTILSIDQVIRFSAFLI